MAKEVGLEANVHVHSRWNFEAERLGGHVGPTGLNCSENRAAVLAPASLDCEAEMGLDTRLRLSCRPPTLL